MSSNYYVSKQMGIHYDDYPIPGLEHLATEQDAWKAAEVMSMVHPKDKFDVRQWDSEFALSTYQNGECIYVRL